MSAKGRTRISMRIGRDDVWVDVDDRSVHELHYGRRLAQVISGINFERNSERVLTCFGDKASLRHPEVVLRRKSMRKLIQRTSGSLVIVVAFWLLPATASAQATIT